MLNPPNIENNILTMPLAGAMGLKVGGENNRWKGKPFNPGNESGPDAGTAGILPERIALPTWPRQSVFLPNA